MKKNEFFEAANLSSVATRSWGAEKEELQVLMCWDDLLVEIDGKECVEIFDFDKKLTKSPQRRERQRMMAQANKGKPTYISLSEGCNDDDRKYGKFDESTVLYAAGRVTKIGDKVYAELTEHAIKAFDLI